MYICPHCQYSRISIIASWDGLPSHSHNWVRIMRMAEINLVKMLTFTFQETLRKEIVQKYTINTNNLEIIPPLSQEKTGALFGNCGFNPIESPYNHIKKICSEL